MRYIEVFIQENLTTRTVLLLFITCEVYSQKKTSFVFEASLGLWNCTAILNYPPIHYTLPKGESFSDMISVSRFGFDLIH